MAEERRERRERREKDTADIANTVESTILKNKENKNLATELATGPAEQILDIMQQSKNTRLPEDKVHQVKKLPKDERGSAILKCVSEADEGVKAGFAIALYAVNPVDLSNRFPDLYNQVSKSAIKEFIKLGGAKIQTEAFRNALKKNLDEVARENKEITIVLVGNSGVGKSTLTNALVGPRKPKKESEAEVGQDKEESNAEVGYGTEPCSTKVEAYRVSLREKSDSDLTFDLVVWDTPGFYDTKESDSTTSDSKDRTRMYIKELATKVKGIDLIIFCLDSTNPRLSGNTSLIIKALNTSFGCGIWEHSLFALTKANLLRSPKDDDDDDIAVFRKTMSNIQKGTQKLMGKHKIESKVYESIPFVPVGSLRDRVLDGKSWLSEFWIAAVQKATVQGSCFLLIYNESRLKDSSSEEYGLKLTDDDAEKIAIAASRVTRAGAGTYAAIYSGGIGLGATIGAAIGAFGGPIGAAVGAGIGA